MSSDEHADELAALRAQVAALTARIEALERRPKVDADQVAARVAAQVVQIVEGSASDALQRTEHAMEGIEGYLKEILRLHKELREIAPEFFAARQPIRTAADLLEAFERMRASQPGYTLRQFAQDTGANYDTLRTTRVRQGKTRPTQQPKRKKRRS